MKSSAKKVELASVDDLFSTEESRLEERLEKIQEISMGRNFLNHRIDCPAELCTYCKRAES